MTSSFAWILGRSGLLGSALARVLQERPEQWTLFDPPVRYTWGDATALEEQFRKAAVDVTAVCGRRGCRSWTAFWTAGTAVMGSTPGHLAAETAAFHAFLRALSHVRPLLPARGTIFFAGSAGALYGDDAGTHTEESPTVPRSDYGSMKLAQEASLRAWAVSAPGTRAVIGRLSTLFGEHQNMDKAQGLISRLSRSFITRQPLPLFVPLDTARDYLYVRDAAGMIASLLTSLPETLSGTITKIIAAERTVTIAELLRILHDITKQPPRIVQQRTPRTDHYPRTLRLRSTVAPRLAAPPTLLPTAVHRVHLHQLRLFAAGGFPAAYLRI